jgi:hypothetical protein
MNKPNDAAEPSLASVGSHRSAARWNGVPVAWAAVGKNGVPMWLAYHRQDAEGAVVGVAEVVPLFRSPALTDDECEAIKRAIDSQQDRAAEMHSRSWKAAAIDEDCDTLLRLLERTK